MENLPPRQHLGEAKEDEVAQHYKRVSEKQVEDVTWYAVT